MGWFCCGVKQLGMFVDISPMAHLMCTMLLAVSSVISPKAKFVFFLFLLVLPVLPDLVHCTDHCFCLMVF